MLSFVVVVRVRVKVVFFIFGVFFVRVSVLEKNKHRRLTVFSFFSLLLNDDGETKAKTTLMVFDEREKKRDGRDPLRARAR